MSNTTRITTDGQYARMPSKPGETLEQKKYRYMVLMEDEDGWPLYVYTGSDDEEPEDRYVLATSDPLPKEMITGPTKEVAEEAEIDLKDPALYDPKAYVIQPGVPNDEAIGRFAKIGKPLPKVTQLEIRSELR